MHTLQAFGEVGYTLLAVVLPLVLLAAIGYCQLEVRSIKRERAQSARESGVPMGVVAGAGISVVSIIILRLIQIILFLLFVLNIVHATIPYGTSHGHW